MAALQFLNHFVSHPSTPSLSTPRKDYKIKEHYEALADHYSKSEDTDKAIEFLEKAGDKAAKSSSLAEARGYYQRTTALLGGIEETKAEQDHRIRVTLKWAEIGTGLPTAELAAACTRAFQCAQNLGARSEMLSIASWEAHFRMVLSDAERGLALAKFVIAEGSGNAPDPAIGRAHTVLGQNAAWSGKPDAAVNHARLARPSLHHGMGSFWDGYLLIVGGISAAFVGDFEDSMVWFNQAMELPPTERAIESWKYVYLGYSFSERSRWEEASQASRKGYDVARGHDDPWPAAWGLITDGYAKFMAGQPRDGHATLSQGIRELEQRGLLYTIPWAYALLAEVTLILNDVKGGVRFSEASKDSLRDSDRFAEPMTYRALAIAGALSEPVEWLSAFSHLQNAIDIAIAAGRLPQAAVTHFRKAEYLHKKGDLSASLQQLSKAEKLFSAMEMTWWSEQAAGLRARIEGGKPFVWFAPYVDGPPKVP